jgi:hypothetical protein
MQQELVLLETDKARYIAVHKYEYVFITGAINVDKTLRRDELPTKTPKQQEDK